MSSSGNLAQMFAQSQSQTKTPLSKAVDAQDDQHFQDTTFQLKRTRSVGLLDEFIAPTRKLIEEDQDANDENNEYQNNNNYEFDDDDESNQFIENIDDIPKLTPKKKSVIYAYEGDEQQSETNDLNDNKKDNENINDENLRSHSGTPEMQPHDDNDISYEPSRHVDYLSHNWKEADISKSWRYIVLKRKDVANSARLENASWRTWAQAKYHLKTISPEAVNWLKESDVTWLYGPLYKEPSSGDISEKKYGSDTESSAVNLQVKKKKLKAPIRKGPKSILKKRTVTEILTKPLPNHHLPSPPIVEDDFNEISKKVNAQYFKHTTENTPNERNGAESPKPRHIHFSDRVDQCIALNYPESDEHYEAENESGEDYESDEEDENDSEDDEGGFFLRVRAQSSSQLQSNFQLSETSDNDNLQPENSNSSNTELARYQTIELLPSTTLKFGSDEEVDNFAMSHNTNTSRGYDYYYDYNSVFKENDTTCKIGSNNYEIEDTPQHLEGVNLVDVPENIVLGPNVEIIETPDFLNENLSPQHLQDGHIQEAKQSQSHITANQGAFPSRSSAGAFSFNSDSESEEEEEGRGFELDRVTSPLSSSSSTKNFGEGLNRVSSSPSYASLSEVAARGYISQGSNNNLSNVISGFNNNNGSSGNNDVNELQRNIGTLNVEEDKNKGFGSSLLNSWKKHS